ncbi:glycosyltransferase family 39 protein [Pseudomonadota bacterium]
MRQTVRLELKPLPAMAILSLCFLTLRGFDAVPRFSDGAIYLYMSTLLNDGILPYKEFFFAHPPLQLVFLSPISLLFGDNFFMTHMSLQLLLVANAWVLYFISKKFCTAVTSLLAPLLYLFSYSIPATGAHWTGVHLSVLLVLSSLLLYLNNRTLLAGIVAGLALFTRYYTLIPLLGMCAGAAAQDARKALHTAAISAGLVLIAILMLLPLGFEAYWEQTVNYHLNKIEGIPKSRVLLFFASHDWLLLLGLVVGMQAFRDRTYWLVLFPQFSLLVFYLIFADIYYYYLVLIVPFLVLNLVHFVDRTDWKNRRNVQWVFAILVAVYLMSSNFRYLTGHARIDNFNQLDELAQWISDNTASGDSIYGAAGITPLIALHSGVPITGRFVDTNPKTFLAGAASLSIREEQLLEMGLKYFVTPAFVQGPDVSGLERYAEISFFESNCQPAHTSPLENSYVGNTLIIWDCKR